MRKRAVTYIRRHKHHAGHRNTAPAPGWRAPPRGADGPQPGAAWTRQRQALLGWAGANTTDSAQRLTRTPVVTAPAVTTHTNGDSSVWLVATAVAEQQATRAGQGAQDITGVACSGAPKQSFSGSLWPRYMRSTVMFSWLCQLTPPPCQAGPGSMPGLACNPSPARQRLALTACALDKPYAHRMQPVQRRVCASVCNASSVLILFPRQSLQ